MKYEVTEAGSGKLIWATRDLDSAKRKQVEWERATCMTAVIDAIREIGEREFDTIQEETGKYSGKLTPGEVEELARALRPYKPEFKALPKDKPSLASLQGLVDTLVKINERYLVDNPQTPPVYNVAPLQDEAWQAPESWRDIGAVLRDRTASTLDLVCWRVAELRHASRERNTPVARALVAIIDGKTIVTVVLANGDCQTWDERKDDRLTNVVRGERPAREMPLVDWALDARNGLATKDKRDIQDDGGGKRFFAFARKS